MIVVGVIRPIGGLFFLLSVKPTSIFSVTWIYFSWLFLTADVNQTFTTVYLLVFMTCFYALFCHRLDCTLHSSSLYPILPASRNCLWDSRSLWSRCCHLFNATGFALSDCELTSASSSLLLQYYNLLIKCRPTFVVEEIVYIFCSCSPAPAEVSSQRIRTFTQ